MQHNITTLICWRNVSYVAIEPPQTPHNVSVARVTSTSVTLAMTSSASLANQPPITSWRVRYRTADGEAREFTADFSADGKNNVVLNDYWNKTYKNETKSCFVRIFVLSVIS